MKSKMKVAILSTYGASMGYNEEAIDMFIPLHISNWEEMKVDEVDNLRTGIEMMNKANKNGMQYKLFIDGGNTKDIIVRSLSEFEKHHAAEVERRNREADAYTKKMAQQELALALRKKSKTIKNAIKALELTGGNQQALEGLRQELESIEKTKNGKQRTTGGI